MRFKRTMSRLYDAYVEEPEAAPQAMPRRLRSPFAYPMVYQGSLTGTFYVQYTDSPFEPREIGRSLIDVEELRDKLTAIIEGCMREAVQAEAEVQIGGPTEPSAA